jgi:disintegrin/metalloproteinase domain-containing protein 1
MPLTLSLPDWVPWWGQLAILVVAILFGFAFLMMPFAVFGLKGRLDFLEAQLDDIHAELRMLASRWPDADRRPARPVEREPVTEEIIPRPRPARTRPQPAPVPPVPVPPVSPAFVSDQPAPVSRRPRGSDDWTGTPALGDDEAAPRRPLRATPFRDAAPDRDHDRTEPTLRWPPR